MDISAELRSSKKRLQGFIDREFLIAQARVEGMTPEEYATKLDSERPNPMEEVGKAYRRMYDSLVDAVNSLTRGWNAAGK